MENTEHRILEAAEAEFVQKGYDGTKTTAIARRAGVTHAMLHYYFGSKERLYEQVLESKTRELSRSIVEAFSRPGRTLTDRLRDGIGLHFDYLTAHPDLPRFVINEAARRDDIQLPLVRGVMRRIRCVVGRLQAEADALCRSEGRPPVSLRRLLLDVVSLNVFTVTACPLLCRLYEMPREEFLALRRAEIIETALRRLKGDGAAPVSAD